jgi:hypothetical protein
MRKTTTSRKTTRAKSEPPFMRQMTAAEVLAAANSDRAKTTAPEKPEGEIHAVEFLWPATFSSCGASSSMALWTPIVTNTLISAAIVLVGRMANAKTATPNVIRLSSFAAREAAPVPTRPS